MSDFLSVDPRSVCESAIKLIGSDWMLITAGDGTAYNTMTASWGGMGYLWNEPVAFVFIRPQRHTFGFTEKNGLFTLSFFGNEYRSALNFCGSHSGRDVDKAEKTGLTPVFGDGMTYFAQASLVFVCEKLYAQDLREDCFISPSLAGINYPAKDYHRMYIGKITECLKKDT